MKDKEAILKKNVQIILDEVGKSLQRGHYTDLDKTVDTILRSNYIVTAGAGRMGYAIKCFSMRLGHLGLKSFHWGDTTCPPVKTNDCLVVASGSGETPHILELVKIAKNSGAKIIWIGVDEASTIANLSNHQLVIKSVSKNSAAVSSVQPMTTLTEQSTLILLDALVLILMKSLELNENTMKAKHCNLE